MPDPPAPAAEPTTHYVNNNAGQVWFDNGRYIGSTPPGAFKDGERLTQQLIRKRIAEVGFQDPMFVPSAVATATSVSNWKTGWR